MSDEPIDPAAAPHAHEEGESGKLLSKQSTGEFGPNAGVPHPECPAAEVSVSETANMEEHPASDLRSTFLAAVEGSWHSVDWNMVRAERIAGWIFFLIVSLGAGGVLLTTTILNWPPGIALGLIWLAFALLAGFVVWVVHFLPAWQYKHLSYRLGSLGLEIQRGIFWKRRITVPISRVQHTDVAQGPLQRRYNVGKIIVYTAGTQNASVELDGLNFQVAGKLRDSLVAQSEAADGV